MVVVDMGCVYDEALLLSLCRKVPVSVDIN